MKLLRDIPIQRKLTIVLLIASTTTLLLASTSMIVWQWFHTRTTVLHALTTQARILADNCTASVAFNDAAAANELLSSLKAMPNLVHARLERRDGSVLAQFAAPGHERPKDRRAPHQAADFSGPYLFVSEPVLLDGSTLAHLEFVFAFRDARRAILAPYFAITAIIFAANLLLALLLSSRLQRLISVPILRLSAVARRIAEHENYSVRAESGGQDELGRLTLAFNSMLARIEAGDTALRQANAELAAEMSERARLSHDHLDLSRRAGMAEVANGVLHNVGNAVNSINVSATLVQDQLAGSQLRELKRAVDLMQLHAEDLGSFISDDPRGRHLPAFIIEVVGLLDAEHANWHQELSALAQNIGHIKEIVAAQQSFGKVAGVIERLPARTLVEDALRLNKPAFDRLGLTPVCDFQPVPDISVDKHKVLQILVNLVKNAIAALKPLPPSERRLHVALTAPNPERIRIAVVDTGVGIPPENLPRIFTHGFTTHAEGHGFGLHASALAAREMAGLLIVQSDGAGQGATFTLELPVHPTSSHFHERE